MTGAESAAAERGGYFTVTVLVADPPALEFTVTDEGAGDVATVSVYNFVLAVYFIGHVPPAVTTVSAAPGAAVLVADTLSCFFFIV